MTQPEHDGSVWVEDNVFTGAGHFIHHYHHAGTGKKCGTCRYFYIEGKKYYCKEEEDYKNHTRGIEKTQCQKFTPEEPAGDCYEERI